MQSWQWYPFNTYVKLKNGTDADQLQAKFQRFSKPFLKGEGDAKATAIYADAYKADPEFYSFYRSLDAYKESFKDKSDVLVLEPDLGFLQALQVARLAIGRLRVSRNEKDAA